MAADPTVVATDITSEEAALAAIADMGYFGVALDTVGATEDFHWHDFDVVLFVLSGEAAAEYDEGRVLNATPGTLAHLPAFVVHRDLPGTSYRGVFGFSTDPATWEGPVNRPLSELPPGR